MCSSDLQDFLDDALICRGLPHPHTIAGSDITFFAACDALIDFFVGPGQIVSTMGSNDQALKFSPVSFGHVSGKISVENLVDLRSADEIIV